MGTGGAVLVGIELLVGGDVVAYPVGGLDEIVPQVGVAGLTEAAVFGGDRTGLGAGPPQASLAGYGGFGREAVWGAQFGEEAGGEDGAQSGDGAEGSVGVAHGLGDTLIEVL